MSAGRTLGGPALAISFFIAPHAAFAGATNCADACNISVGCAPDVRERQAVVRIRGPAAGGLEITGTGYLVNHSEFVPSLRPFVMTALHLFDQNQDGTVTDAEVFDFTTNMTVDFGFDADCSGQPQGPVFTAMGGGLVSNDLATDSALLRLNILKTDLEASADVFYAGWDVLAGPPGFSHTVHHPRGDRKMISGVTGVALTNGNFTVMPGLDCGGAEPGSSGAPMFETSTRRAVGPLSRVFVDPPADPGDIRLVCAPDFATELWFGTYNGWASQFLGAQPSTPPSDRPPPTGSLARLPPLPTVAYASYSIPHGVTRRIAASSVVLAAGFYAPAGSEVVVRASR